MGIFDFMKDSGDREGLAEEDSSDLQTGNAVARKLQSAQMTIEGMDVRYDDGTVRLSGRVADQQTRELAVLIAGNTPGVARVDDRLRVDGGGTDAFGDRLHTVRAGDTLSEIAQERLGDASRWEEIFEANRPMLQDPDRIYPGQVLRIPSS